MRGIAGFISGLLLLTALAVGAAVVLRGPVAGYFIVRVLADMGLESPSLRVETLTLSEIEIADLAAGGGDLSLSRVAVAYDWRTLVAARRARTVTVGPGAARLKLSPSGALTLAGMRLPPQGEGGPLPFEALALDELALSLSSPEGEATGRLAGAFAPETGGAFSFTAEADRLSVGDLVLSRLAASGETTLAEDGGVAFAASLSGDAASPAVAARGVALAATGEARSWRAAMAGEADGFSGAATLDLQSAEIPAASAPMLAALARPGETGAAIDALHLSGGLAATFGPGGVAVLAREDAPLRVAADRGDALTVAALDGAPLYETAGEVRRLALRAELAGAASGAARLTANAGDDGPWAYELFADFAEQTIAGVAFGATALAIAGTAGAERFDAEMSLTGVVKSAPVGRFLFSDAAVRALLSIRTDLAAKTLAVAGDRAKCVFLDRARLAIPEQNSDARLTRASFCENDGPLLEAAWNGAPRARLAGRLMAEAATYRIGETRFSGAPPTIDFAADYAPETARTDAEGTFAGGRVVINDALLVTESAGRFTAYLSADGLGGEATASRARIAQTARAPQLAPVIASGSARLDGERVTFDYAAATPSGAPLGRGEGAHDMTVGRGETTFRTGDLVFARGGLQPDALAPGLKGIVFETVGAAAARLVFGWGQRPEDFRSSGEIEVRNLTFRGPGLAVSRTGDLNGVLSLASLAPLQSDGVQRVEIGLIDLNTLKLENGVVEFDLPGDETLRIVRGAFPWFGGEIGVYEATASLAGDAASVPLRVENIDFGEVLAYFDVNGLSGEGRLEGVLPLLVEEGKAKIAGGEFRSLGPGAIRYTGAASDAAAAADPQAEIAFTILRDLRYSSLRATIDGPLDGRLDIRANFEGVGEVPSGGRRTARVPVKYNIALDAALFELLDQAALTYDIQRQLDRARSQQDDGVDALIDRNPGIFD